MKKIGGKVIYLALFISILLNIFFVIYEADLIKFKQNENISSAAAKGNVGLLIELVASGEPIGSNAINHAVWTYYATSWRRGHTIISQEREQIDYKIFNMVRILIENGADVNYREDSVSKVPLYYAIAMRLDRTVKLLLENGAETNIIQGEEPLLYMALTIDSDSNTNYFELLINYGADVNIKDKEGNTVLHLAISRNLSSGLDLLNLLEQNNFDFCSTNKAGETPMDLAKYKNRTDYIDLLERFIK